MKALSRSIEIVVGIVFLSAGMYKVLNLSDSAVFLVYYLNVPTSVSWIVAGALGIWEQTLGVFLILGTKRIVMSILAIASLIAFSVVLVLAILPSGASTCGCRSLLDAFGIDAGSPHGALVRNGIMVAGLVVVVVRHHSRTSGSPVVAD